VDEYLKSLVVVGLSWLTRLCNITWRSGTVPLDWQTRVVVPLFKKGDRRVWSNYRGITLLSLPGKVYARVLERRIRPIVEPRIQEEQCGFSSRSWNTGLVLYPLQEGSAGGFMEVCPTNPHVFCGFGEGIQLCPLRHPLVGALGVLSPGPSALLKVAWFLYDRSRSLVRIVGCKSDLFPVHVGLQQGCPLCPVWGPHNFVSVLLL